MERRLFLTNIYDFYGVLLTERQRELFEMYYLNDLSLGEIAEQTGVSRPAVWDLLKRTVKNLCEYEEKLNLFGKHKAAVLKFEEIKEFTDTEMILKGFSEVIWGE